MNNISFIGGDSRNLILANLIKSDGFNIYKSFLGTKEDINIEESVKKSDIIITSIPFSNDGVFVNTKLSYEQLKITQFFSLLKNKTIIGGKFSKEQINELEKNNNTVIDLMKNEELALKNAIPTVEGIVKLIIENTKITIDNSNIAIIGFGRIGKRASSILKQMGANIFCMDTSEEEVANINLCGYNVIENIHTKNKFDIIVNTVPKLVIGEEEFKFINKETLIIDVASKPGGIDFNFAEKNGYTVIHELGIPGKIAPLTAAKYMYEVIKKIIL